VRLQVSVWSGYDLCDPVSVCPVRALTFQSLDLETSFLVCRYIFTTSTSTSYVKVNVKGQSSKEQDIRVLTKYTHSQVVCLRLNGKLAYYSQYQNHCNQDDDDQTHIITHLQTELSVRAVWLIVELSVRAVWFTVELSVRALWSALSSVHKLLTLCCLDCKCSYSEIPPYVRSHTGQIPSLQAFNIHDRSNQVRSRRSLTHVTANRTSSSQVRYIKCL